MPPKKQPRPSYAEFSQEKKDHINARRRELRLEKKRAADANPSTDQHKRCRINEIGSTSNVVTASESMQCEDVFQDHLFAANEGNLSKSLQDEGVHERPVPTEAFALSVRPPCKFCGAKKFPLEPDGFCCSSGEILSNAYFLLQKRSFAILTILLLAIGARHYMVYIIYPFAGYWCKTLYAIQGFKAFSAKNQASVGNYGACLADNSKYTSGGLW